MHNIFPLPLHRDPEGQGRACSPVSLRTALVYAPGREALAGDGTAGSWACHLPSQALCCPPWPGVNQPSASAAATQAEGDGFTDGRGPCPPPEEGTGEFHGPRLREGPLKPSTVPPL